MPVIHILSLPLPRPVDGPGALAAISRDFARDAGIGLEHVTVTWQLLSPGFYVHNGQPALQQPTETHPLQVRLLAPDFNSASAVERMLESAAGVIARHLDVPLENIFIHYEPARSGQVFDAGGLVRW